MKKRNVGNLVVNYLTDNPNAHPTLLQLCKALRIPAGTDVGRRIREKRAQMYAINTYLDPIDERWHYFLEKDPSYPQKGRKQVLAARKTT